MAGGDYLHSHAVLKSNKSNFGYLESKPIIPDHSHHSDHSDRSDRKSTRRYSDEFHLNHSDHSEHSDGENTLRNSGEFHSDEESARRNSDEFYLDLRDVSNTSTVTSPLPTTTTNTQLETRTGIRYINSAIFIEHMDESDESTFRVSDTQQIATPPTIRKCAVDTCNRLTPGRSFARFNEESRPKGMTFEEWLASKQLKLKPVKSKPEEVSNPVERQTRLNDQREDFKKWLALKREQELVKRKELEALEAKKKAMEEEKAKRAVEKESMLKVWIKRKEEQTKLKKRREERERRKKEEERQLRKEMSKRAFELWMSKAKFSPKPVPLNMGVDSLRGSVSAMFVNPTPWQENIEMDIRASQQSV